MIEQKKEQNEQNNSFKTFLIFRFFVHQRSIALYVYRPDNAYGTHWKPNALTFFAQTKFCGLAMHGWLRHGFQRGFSSRKRDMISGYGWEGRRRKG